MPTTTDSTTAMNQVVQNLRDAVVQAQADIASSWSLADTDASTNALQMMGNNIDALDTTIRGRVDDGEIDFSAWLDIATQDLSAIRAYDSNITDYSQTNAWKYTITQTASQIADAVKGLPDLPKNLLSNYWYVFVIAFAFLILMAVIRVG